MVGGPLQRLLLSAFLLLMTTGVLSACGNSTPAASAETVSATVLIEPEAGEAQWFRDVAVPAGTTGYELLLAATDGEVEAEFSSEFQSHFIEGILGRTPEGQEFWGNFVWNDEAESWEPVPTGADLVTVEDGDVMGWALVEYDPSVADLPTARP
ncbi:MAG: hypothetical protein WD645_00225 [Dehalococcoidia bacterium]